MVGGTSGGNCKLPTKEGYFLGAYPFFGVNEVNAYFVDRQHANEWAGANHEINADNLLTGCQMYKLGGFFPDGVRSR